MQRRAHPDLGISALIKNGTGLSEQNANLSHRKTQRAWTLAQVDALLWHQWRHAVVDFYPTPIALNNSRTTVSIIDVTLWILGREAKGEPLRILPPTGRHGRERAASQTLWRAAATSVRERRADKIPGAPHAGLKLLARLPKALYLPASVLIPHSQLFISFISLFISSSLLSLPLSSLHLFPSTIFLALQCWLCPC